MNAQNFTFCTARAMVPAMPSRPRPFARPRTPPRSAVMSAVEKREKPPVDWELVLKRNPVERLKKEKAPLGIRDELPALIAAGLRERRRGGRRPPPVVGPLPRQAEDRHVHAPREGAGREALAAASCARSARPRTSSAGATASSRRARTSSSTGSSSRSCPTSSRTSRRRARPPPAAAATRSATSPAAPSRASRPTSSSTATRRRRARPTSSTATPTGPTCRASTSTRSPRAPTAATRRRSTASR